MSIPFKPRGSKARDELKQLKEGFDNSEIDSREPIIEWAARSGASKPFQAYGGEFLHQLALRSERRGEIERANRLYMASEHQLEGNALGLARTLRDHGLFIVEAQQDRHRGIAMIEQALQLHDSDIDNEKGRRQRLITQTKLWRAQMLVGGKQATAAKQQLIELALGPDFTFHPRDRKVIIDFLIPRTKGNVRRSLLNQKAMIHSERRQPLRAAETYLKLLVDVELSIANSIIRQIFRRE